MTHRLYIDQAYENYVKILWLFAHVRGSLAQISQTSLNPWHPTWTDDNQLLSWCLKTGGACKIIIMW